MATPLRFLRSDPPYLPGEIAWFDEADARRIVAHGVAEIIAVAVVAPEHENPLAAPLEQSEEAPVVEQAATQVQKQNHRRRGA